MQGAGTSGQREGSLPSLSAKAKGKRRAVDLEDEEEFPMDYLQVGSCHIYEIPELTV